MKFINKVQIVTAISLSLLAQSAYSAIALDRTRIIYNEQDKTVGMGLTVLSCSL